MRRPLAALAGIFVLLLIGGVLLAGSLFHAVVDTSRSARSFVDDAVPAITGQWNAAALSDRAAPELLRQNDKGSLKVLFLQFSALGPLVTYQGATLRDSSEESVSGAGTVSAAHFQVKASYAHGNAVIDLVLVKRDAGWRILGFHVLSPALPAQPPSQAL